MLCCAGCSAGYDKYIKRPFTQVYFNVKHKIVLVKMG